MTRVISHSISFLASRWAAVFVVASLAFAASSATAQNLLRNGDFESPLGPTNWVVQYGAPNIPTTDAYGGPGDFAIADRTTEGSRIAGGYGGHFRAVTDWSVKAYFTQTVSNLTLGATYHLSGYMKVSNIDTSKFFCFFEAVGGSGQPTVDNRFFVRTPDATNGPTQLQYFLDQTPDNLGRIEVRLHFIKLPMVPGQPSYTKYFLYSVYFDDFVLTP